MKSANLFINKGQSGDGGRTFHDKIPFKGFKEGVKNVSLGTSPFPGVRGNILDFVLFSLFLALKSQLFGEK